MVSIRIVLNPHLNFFYPQKTGFEKWLSCMRLVHEIMWVTAYILEILSQKDKEKTNSSLSSSSKAGSLNSFNFKCIHVHYFLPFLVCHSYFPEETIVAVHVQQLAKGVYMVIVSSWKFVLF